MDSPIWQTQFGDGPLVAAAIHDGHQVRQELQDLLSLDDAARRREEDPFTADWTSLAPTRILVMRSRFEIDLNRPREKAVYRSPEDAWGLQVWKRSLPPEIIERSLAAYDAFYDHLKHLLSRLVRRHGTVVLFDLHSYNHRRNGPDDKGADPEKNPEINVGTGTLDRQRWAPLLDRCIADLRAFRYHGRHLDVRENVKFYGGHFPRWIHETFPETVCAVSLEFKKFFMDEWTGQPDPTQLDAIGKALERAAEGALQERRKLLKIRERT